MTNLEGKPFAGYEVVAKLGDGDLGAVYKARQPKPDRVVVLKLLEPRLAGDAEFLKRFKREAAAAADLGHPNLMQVYGAGEHQGIHYVATEFAEGDTLGKRLARRGRLEPREALAITFYVVRALLYAWSKAKLAHLNIRPESIFLRKAGDVKLDGLGMAKPAATAASRLPHYTSPEQAQAAGEIDFRADIYSLGCVLYHMLAGKTPYEGDNAKALLAKRVSEPPPDITKVWPTCPASLGRLLGRMMARQTADRHRNYDDLIKELLEVREEVKQATRQRTAIPAKSESRTFAGYTLLAKLSQDDSSAVYKAYQPSPKRLVALKVLASRLSKNSEFVARFKRGTAAAAGLNHPNIVQVYSAGEADGACYVALEFVEGRTLRQRLERRGQLHPREALAITFYVAQALEHAWNKAKLAHGGLTPDNIVLTGSGEVKVGDFGTAKILEEAQGTAASAKAEVPGSLYYMSPEQGRGVKELDCRADIYSLGCMLYHILTGKTPYDGDTPAAIAKKHVNDPPPAILKAWPTCPAMLARLMDKMLAKSRRDRPQSYDDLLTEMVKVREEFKRVKVAPPAAPGATAPIPAEPSKAKQTENESAAEPVAWNRSPIFIGAGIAAVVLLGGLLVWAPWKKPAIQSSPQEEQRVDDSSPRVTPFAQTPTPRREVARATIRSDTTTAYTPPASKPWQPEPKPMTTPIAPPEPPPAPAAGDTKAPEAPADNPMAPRATLARVGSKEIVLDMPSSAVPSEQPMTDEAFAAAVAPLPPQEQVKRVIARLQELNPGFSGKGSYKIENNVVAELTISTTGSLVPTVGVTDMTPIKTLKSLQRLVLAPAKPGEQGALADLSALSGMTLTWLSCHGNPQLQDLSPLKDMPLTGLTCGGTLVKDLTPLSAMRLATLGINDTPVEDISALNGMPLAVLWCQNSKVADLTPLKGAPLRELRCDFMMVRDGPVLRDIRTLARINDLPAATFWKRANLATAAPSTVLSAVKAAPDFKSLFNGKDMTGWRARTPSLPDGWRVRRGTMINTPPSSDIVSAQQFDNFEFYCEYKTSRRCHSGVLLRGRYRIPILNDAGQPPSVTCSGSVHELLAPTKNASKPPDTWQALYVRLVGSTVTVILNGKKVIDGRGLDESSGSFGGDVVKSGPILLMGGSSVIFRNLRIKPLLAKEN
ncbi:MAG: protein kinase [Verrucomicrobia bacterium]|nr:protein kinase [Verrucomicrobiota bacterium]